MEMFRIMFWMIYPYIVIAILGMALVWQIKSPGDQDGEDLNGRFSLLLNGTIKGLMILSLLSGIGVIWFYHMSNEPEKLFYWVKSLVVLNPDTSLIENISILTRTHFILLLTFILVLSFSSKISYLWRPHLYFKRKFLKKME